MRDVLLIPGNNGERLIVASDNSGAIGEKEKDLVKAPYEVVAYFSFRTALMECMAAGAKPLAVVLQNFCGELAWDKLIAGIHRGFEEAGIRDINITGSTESNFSLEQSAIGLSVMGSAGDLTLKQPLFSNHMNIAVIGKPLVGEEVLQQPNELAPLSLFKLLCEKEQLLILPVGSKGILSELNSLFSNRSFELKDLASGLDYGKSGGPSTCFIVVYDKQEKETVREISGGHFHEIYIGG